MVEIDRPFQERHFGKWLYLKLRNHFNIYSVRAGGEVIEKSGYTGMPDPDAWDAADDADHYKLVYGGWYARYNAYVDRNVGHRVLGGCWWFS